MIRKDKIVVVICTSLILILGLVFAQSAVGNPRIEENARFCLAQNIYFESGNQPLAGRIAVAQVTMNRMYDEQFPNNVCGVVYQAKMRTNWLGDYVPIRHKCQFSWFCDGKSDTPTDSITWLQCVWLAGRVLENYYPDITEGALWYHSNQVRPYWSKQLNRTVTIDNHLFYN